MKSAVCSGFGIFCVLCVVAFPAVAAAGEWETLKNCRLLPNESNDGDSFHVEYKGEEYIFRLYFVDAPESHDQVPSRVDEQAKVFGVSRERVLEAGEEAARFTAEKLRRPFSVLTKWQDAQGASQLPRRYALVETSEGQDIGELLTEAGLARSYGVAAVPPGKNESAVRSKYDRLAKRAESSCTGVWGKMPSDTPSADSEGEQAAGQERELGDVPGMPNMDTLTDSLQMMVEPVPADFSAP